MTISTNQRNKAETKPNEKTGGKLMKTPDTILDFIPPRLLARDKRKDRRSIATINKIMVATEDLLLNHENTKITILSVCKHAGVSRGTLYRYFSSLEELLDLFTEFMRERFYKRLENVLDPYIDIDEKFDAFIDYFDKYLANGTSKKFLQVAPLYALNYYGRIFDEAVQNFKHLLEDVFDEWEARIDKPIDRELICEMMMRLILSEQLTSGKTPTRKLLVGIKKMII